MNELDISDEFTMSLFINDKDSECTAAKVNSHTYNGPFFAYLSFDINDYTVIGEYYDSKSPIIDSYHSKADQLNYFAHFVNRKNIKIKIVRHTDKTETKSEIGIYDDVTSTYYQAFILGRLF